MKFPFPKYPRELGAFPRYHPPYPIPYVEVPQAMDYSVYSTSNPYSKRRNGKKTMLPSSGARMAQIPYAYEDPYADYAEDIQYSTVGPLIQPLPYTYQWSSGWGSANEEAEAPAGEEEEKKWWQKVDFEKVGKGISGLWNKNKTKKSAKKSAKKGRKRSRKMSSYDRKRLRQKAKKAGASAFSTGGFSPIFMKSLQGTPDMDKAFWVYGKSRRSGMYVPLPFTQRVLNTSKALSKSAISGKRVDKLPLPPRTSNLFQQQALKTQPIVKAISGKSSPQQANLTARSQSAEKSLKKKEKSSNTLVAVGGLSVLLVAAGGGYMFYRKKKEKEQQQGSQAYYGNQF